MLRPFGYLARMRQIVKGIHQLSGGSHAFIVDGDEGVVLIDTLMPRRESAITSGLASIGRSPNDVVAILLTHSHFDHTGGVAALKSESGAPVFASSGDAPAIRGEERPPPPPLIPKWISPAIRRILPAPHPVELEREVSEGDALPGDISVIDTPGHTPGHTSYLLDRAGGLLFVGDAAVAKDGEIRRGFFNRRGPAWDASIGHIADQTFELACFGHSDSLRTGADSAFQRYAAKLIAS